jgi:hypothetical protein
MIFRPILLAVFVLAGITGAHAQDKPNFSGTWKMNLEKSKLSDGSSISYYSEFIQEIDHQEPKLRITERIKEAGGGGDRTVIWNLNTDGKEYDTKVVEAAAKISASWDGDRLITHIAAEDWKVVRKSQIAKDGKSITAEFEVTLGDGSTVKAMEVWERQ